MIKGFLKLILFTVILLAMPVALFLITNYGGMVVYKFFKGFSKDQLELIYKFARVISPVMFIAVPSFLWGLYFKSRNRKKEIIRKSEENNTFITAHLVRKSRIRHTGKRHGFDYEGIYEYTVNGETKERRICFNGGPPDEIRLYPKNENGSKFFSNAGHEDKIWFAVPLLCLATFILWLWILIPLTILDDF